jgi:hypothetical protein
MPKYFDEQGKEVTPPAPANDKVVVKVGDEEKTFTAQDVEGLVAKQSEATQKAQSAAAVLNAAEQLGIDPEQFLARSQAAFTVLNDLVEQKVIDDEGQVIVKTAKEEPPTKTDDEDLPAGGPTMDRTTKAILKALAPTFDKIEERFSNAERDMTRVNRIMIQDKILQEHPSLNGDDVMRIFGMAKANPQKSVLQHAEDFSKAKDEARQQQEKEFADKYGVNLDEFNENKLKESSDEGGAAAMFKGKKMSFRKGENTVSPREATKEFLDKNL